MRSADMPGPGSRFGHEVTMRHLGSLGAGDRGRGEDAGGGGAEKRAARGHGWLH